MSQKSKTVPMDNGPGSQDTSELLGGIATGELRRIMSEARDQHFDELKKHLDRMSETTDRMLRATYQR